jgi:hypothetical protein
MRETQKEGKKLALLNKYKRAVVRVQLPDRHVIQAVFPPGAGNTNIEFIRWFHEFSVTTNLRL